MSIRPIDPQSVLHKAGESQRTTAASREQPNPGQHHFLQELQQQSARRQQMVRKSEDAEPNKLQPDEGQDQPQGQARGRGDHRRRKQQATWVQDRERGTHLDIKV